VLDGIGSLVAGDLGAEAMLSPFARETEAQLQHSKEVIPEYFCCQLFSKCNFFRKKSTLFFL
jgi:hypothetical protein